MGGIRLLVKSAYMNGGEGSLEGVDKSARVSQLKVVLAEVGGVDIPVEYMRILFKGKKLCDEDDIANTGMQDRDCIVVLKGRSKEDALSPDLVQKKAPGRLEILDAVNAVQADARSRRMLTDDVNEDEDEDMLDADRDENDERPETGLGSADLLNALQASAMNGGVEGLEEQLHSILSVLARFDGRSRGSSQRSDASREDGEDDEEGEGVSLSRVGMTAAEQFFRPPDPDPEYVEQLKDMGFPEPRARKALILCRNSMTRATDWLLEHADDADVDTELTEADLRSIARNSFLTAQRLSRRFPNA